MEIYVVDEQDFKKLTPGEILNIVSPGDSRMEIKRLHQNYSCLL